MKRRETSSIDFRLIKERTYRHNEIKSMAESILNREGILGNLIKKKLGPILSGSWSLEYWMFTVYESIASKIMEEEDHVITSLKVDLDELIAKYHSELQTEGIRIAEDFGIFDLASQLRELFGTNTEAMKLHPFWNEIQKRRVESQREFKDQALKAKKLLWQRFYKRYVQYLRNNTVVRRPSSQDVITLKLIIKSGERPLDLFVLTTEKSWLSQPFYFVEVKAGQGGSVGATLSLSQKRFIEEYVGTVGILILRFFLGTERIRLGYYEPLRNTEKLTRN